MKEYTRNELFDRIKGIAIFLVVAGHLLPDTAKTAAAFITACHMPVFFFVSGYFFWNSYDKQNGIGFLRKKIKTLLFPFLFWSSVSLAVNGLPAFLKKDYAGVLSEFVEIFIYARSAWFLIVLFMASILYFVIQKCAAIVSVNQIMLGIAAWG